MKTLIAVFVSLLLHGLLFFLMPSLQQQPDFVFRKGEIAMELLPSQKSLSNAPVSKEGTVLNNSPQKGAATPSSGVQSGSSLGISAPEYPESSRIQGEEGNVIVAFDLDEAEKLIGVEIEKSSGFEKIDKAALKAIEKHYAPSTNASQKKHFRVRFNFQLTK